MASGKAAIALLLLVALTYVVGQDQQSLYLVLMEGEPARSNNEAANQLAESHNQLLQTNLGIGNYNKLYSFKHVINGFAVQTTPSQVQKLKDSPLVKVVEKDRGAKLMTTYTPRFLGLQATTPFAADSHPDSTVNGEGVIIGFVDTGIDPRHPSFAYDPDDLINDKHHRFSGACETGPAFPPSSCNGKIVSARFFSAGAQSIATLNTSLDFLSPFDAVGHGTHVASTAAGNADIPVVVNGFHYGRASGMAPRARIAVYKAAIKDGVDILTVSVGPDTPPEDTTVTFLSVFDIAMLYARRSGIFVVQAAGNLGPDPSTVVSYSPWAMSVAACTTDRTYPASLLLGDGQLVHGIGLSEECQHPDAFEPSLVQGSIVVCTFSGGFYNQTSTVAAIIETARQLGFLGFALAADPAYGDFIAEPIPFDVPAAGIIIPKVADTQIVMKYYEQHISRDARGQVAGFNGRARIGEGRVSNFGGRSPIVSRFSSRGPDYAIVGESHRPTDVLKPDILAPGHQVWAAWSPLSALEPLLAGYSFALMSGTSMATAHVGGIAALVRQHNPSWNPSMIASAITTTASKYDSHGDLISAQGPGDLYTISPATYFDFGAGLISPGRALDPGLVLSSEFKDYIDFLCSLPDIDWVKIRAATGVSCNQKLTHLANLNLPSVTISALRFGHPIQLQRRFKSVGTKPETYLCYVLSPNGTTVSVSPTWFRIAPLQTQDIRIELHATAKEAVNAFSFGEIVLTGSLDHIVRLPLSVLLSSSTS
ncbi:Subtilisin-like protease SBT2.4 [Linum grandiflorum]